MNIASIILYPKGFRYPIDGTANLQSYDCVTAEQNDMDRTVLDLGIGVNNLSNKGMTASHRSKRAKPDRKGARAPFETILSATATRCFSTELAGCRPSLQSRTNHAAMLKAA